MSSSKVLTVRPVGWRRGDWHSRGYIPHNGDYNVVQSVTLRLYDTLPQNKLDEFKISLRKLSDSERDAGERKYLDEWLDQSYGSCFLREPKVADLVVKSLLFKHGKEYELHAWVVMPNHIHFMLTLYEGFGLADVIRNFKSYTARKSNLILGRRGPFWFREYFDRYIRDAEHYSRSIHYIESNPVLAGLCQNAREWEFSSANESRKD